MSIEKRIIAGQAVGYNTETRSFCNLPKDYESLEDEQFFEDENTEGIHFDEMTDEQLAEHAEKYGIDISRCTTRNGIIAKLKKAEQEAE